MYYIGSCTFSITLFRVNAIMGHVQTIYNFPTLDASMELKITSIEKYNGKLEANTGNLM